MLEVFFMGSFINPKRFANAKTMNNSPIIDIIRLGIGFSDQLFFSFISWASLIAYNNCICSLIYKNIILI